MQVSDFDFDLPDELIARYPAPERTGSRLLCVNPVSGSIRHKHFQDILELLNPEDLLVFNDTRVIPARLFGKKETGGQIEILVERIENDNCALCHVRASKSPKPGTRILLDEQVVLEMVERQGDLFRLRFPPDETVLSVLNRIGHMPLPPYIDRVDQQTDRERYQTVYGRKEGAVAAPTAGLHFDQALLDAVQAKGVSTAFVTLHVGAGTFQPVRVERVEEHQMHSELAEVSSEVCDLVAETRARGGRVIAVGTTSVRALESASRSGALQPLVGETDIFIYPGYRFRSVDALITNFHLPRSTLLMLVSAFAGRECMLRAYAEAVEQQYRFFSYGDAMFIECSAPFHE